MESTGTARHVLFLDFDGVITNLATAYERADPACIVRLNEITDAVAVEIVVTSSWRTSVRAMARLLRRWGATGRVTGITPNLLHTRGSERVERGEEIRAWLQAQDSAVLGFVILDDQSDMADLREHLIQTNDRMGLCADDVARTVTRFELLGAASRKKG